MANQRIRYLRRARELHRGSIFSLARNSKQEYKQTHLFKHTQRGKK